MLAGFRTWFYCEISNTARGFQQPSRKSSSLTVITDTRFRGIRQACRAVLRCVYFSVPNSPSAYIIGIITKWKNTREYPAHKNAVQATKLC